MKRVDLTQVVHKVQIRDKCPYIEPNIINDSIFYADDVPIGFYISEMPKDLCNLAQIANHEFLSNRVPKQGRGGSHHSVMKDGVLTNKRTKQSTQHKSTSIIGMVPPQERFGRNYCKASNLHDVKSAENYIKAMAMLIKGAEKIVKEILPNQYALQQELMKDCPKKLRVSDLFTSSISNLNVSAPYHRDKANLEGTVNVIITKRLNSKGGCLNVPDYNATIEQADNSLLVYPAWRNIHGVTPILPTFEGGYRNSLVFYPLKAFKGRE